MKKLPRRGTPLLIHVSARIHLRRFSERKNDEIMSSGLSYHLVSRVWIFLRSNVQFNLVRERERGRPPPQHSADSDKNIISFGGRKSCEPLSV